ncbi:MAG TPA: chemotaxis protein CheB [Planctomycetota bacterium]|nr:chemotaxis protein CheB [Planctomycetota bacterium]
MVKKKKKKPPVLQPEKRKGKPKKPQRSRAGAAARGKRFRAEPEPEPEPEGGRRIQRGDPAFPGQPPPFPIVGIGASAGGLEAFTAVLRALPTDTGMAFVIVQHLAPEHDSILSTLLANTTDMPVFEVEDGLRVEPNHVYVIPPNVNMGVLHAVLHLIPRGGSRGHFMPIDFFFRSLAEEQKEKAIGVVLSGTASDGALGLKAIKAEGGITLAQSPQSSKYDGMPRAAISAGVVDVVLAPEEIAMELTKIGRHPYIRRPLQKVPEPMEGDDNLSKVFFLLRSLSGVDFTHYKQATIKRRIRRRMVLHKIDRLSEYIRYLQHNAGEVEALYQDILIHVTGFFRDPETFEALKTAVYPQVLKNRPPDSPIRIWVPGCSTGEEAYSLAISLIEFLGPNSGGTLIQIFATDISRSAIEKARVGFYPESITSDVSEERLRRFFAKADGGYRIAKSIRDMCVFAKQDVTRDPPFSKLDLISCRNVLIYLGPILQKRAMTVFHYALKPTGFLLLGSSESIGSFSDLFSLKDKHKIYSPQRTEARLNMAFSADYGVEKSTQPKPLPKAKSPPADLRSDVDRLILEKYAPAGVIINNDLQIVQVRGQTGRYLEPAPGQATLSILKMARQGLLLELRTAIHTSRKQNTAVRKEGLRVKQNGDNWFVDLEVLPLEFSGERHFLILFQDSKGREDGDADERIGRGARRKPAPRGKAEPQKVQKLETELAATRGYLQSIIQDQEATNEELQSSNEEVLSSNEELQSTNEELETAKEELQSTNEELNTVNEELRTRNQELSQVNSDLMNLLTSAYIPLIIVGSDLRIRRFTPMAEKAFNLIPGDVGRPIGDIKSNINIANLPGLILETVESVTVTEREVQDLEGHWYTLRIRPYKTVDNRIDGAVLALMDIDAVRRGMEQLKEGAEYACAAADLVERPLIVIDGELRVKKTNRAFQKTFGLGQQETEGKILNRVGNGQWNDPSFKGFLQSLLEKQATPEDSGGLSCFWKTGQRTHRVTGTELAGGANRSRAILVAFDNVEPSEAEGHTPPGQ